VQVPDKHKAERALRKTVQPWLGHSDYFEVTGGKDSLSETIYMKKLIEFLLNNLFDFYYVINSHV